MKLRLLPIVMATTLMLTTNVYALDFMHQDDVYSMAIEICKPYNISPELVTAIIWKESRFATDAVSENGKCIGLCQISKGSHRARMERLGVTDLTNPYDNIRVAVDYLSELYADCDDTAYVLDRYNGNSNAKSNYEKGKVSKYASIVCEMSYELERRYEK